jgi:hypothetical protein
MDPQTTVTPAATDEEAAAIAAALTSFTHDLAAPTETVAPGQTPWQRVALREGVDRAPGRQ